MDIMNDMLPSGKTLPREAIAPLNPIENPESVLARLEEAIELYANEDERADDLFLRLRREQVYLKICEIRLRIKRNDQQFRVEVSKLLSLPENEALFDDMTLVRVIAEEMLRSFLWTALVSRRSIRKAIRNMERDLGMILNVRENARRQIMHTTQWEFRDRKIYEALDRLFTPH